MPGEIVLGKFKGIIKSIIGVLIIIYGILSIGAFFYLQNHINNHLNNNIFVSIPIAGIIIGFGVFLFIYGIFQYSNFRMYTIRYKKDCMNHSIYAQYPPFLKDIFIKRIKWRYYTILITAITYTLALVLIPIFYLIQNYQGESFSFAWWTIGTTPNIKNIIIGSWCVVILVTILLGINILINEKRHSIISIYTSNNVLNEAEKKEISKKTKKKCYIIYAIFLSLLIIFLIFLILFLLKKKKTKVVK